MATSEMLAWNYNGEKAIQGLEKNRFCVPLT